MICGLNLRQNRCQNKMACKNPIRGGHRSCSLRTLGSWHSVIVLGSINLKRENVMRIPNAFCLLCCHDILHPPWLLTFGVWLVWLSMSVTPVICYCSSVYLFNVKVPVTIKTLNDWSPNFYQMQHWDLSQTKLTCFVGPDQKWFVVLPVKKKTSTF